MKATEAAKPKRPTAIWTRALAMCGASPEAWANYLDGKPTADAIRAMAAEVSDVEDFEVVGAAPDPFGEPGEVVRAVLSRIGVAWHEPGDHVPATADGSMPNEHWQEHAQIPDELFNAGSLATLEGVPVTIGHPKRLTALAVVGVVQSVTHDEKSVLGELRIFDPIARERIRSGELCEVSCGSRYDLEASYDGRGALVSVVRRNIRYHHVAQFVRGGSRLTPDTRILGGAT